MNTKRHLTITVLIAVMFFAIPAKADLSFYTDRSDWEIAISGDISTETFDSVTPYFLVGGVNSAGLINIELVNLSEVNQWNSINNGSDVEDFLTIDGTAFYQGGRRLTDPDTVIHLHRPFPVRAFGGDFTSTHSSTDGNGLALLVNGTQYGFQQLLDFEEGSGFLGFIATADVSTVTLFAPENNETFGLDNVSFAVIPEPVSLSLLVFGSFYLQKRRKV